MTAARTRPSPVDGLSQHLSHGAHLNIHLMTCTRLHPDADAHKQTSRVLSINTHHQKKFCEKGVFTVE